MIPVEHLDILGKKYRLLGSTETGLTVLDRQVNAGNTSNHQTTITVAMNQSRDQMHDTLIHEILHTLDYAVRLNLKEKQVHRLAAVLLAVFRANPDLLRLLLGEVEWAIKQVK